MWGRHRVESACLPLMWPAFDFRSGHHNNMMCRPEMNVGFCWFSAVRDFSLGPSVFLSPQRH